ncbi:MAG TPA: hypothetical protein VK031_07255, partial [Tissierellaceae bacterium]|nr:hypothetical protein [Tissierellaceae bacterium]
IKSVLRRVDVDDNNCRVIYSDGNDTKLKVSRGKTTDEPKKINFITSKAFEGADIYDVDGKVVVISDGNREHTLLDISTKLIQITGRIRDTKYFDEIYHITAFNRYDDNKLTYDEYRTSILTSLSKDEEFINYNIKRFKEQVVKYVENGVAVFHYLDKEGNVKYDSNRIKIDLYNYKIANEIYKNRINLTSAYNRNNLNNSEFKTVDNSHIEIKNLDDVVNDFKVAIEAIKERYEKGEEYLSLVMGYYEQFPYLLEAVSKLGFKEIKEMKYRTSNIKRKLEMMKLTNKEDSYIDKVKVALRYNTGIKVGMGYTGKELKELLQKTYDEVGCQSKAKGVDINDYYLTTKKSVREDNKVVTKTFIVAKKH